MLNCRNGYCIYNKKGKCINEHIFLDMSGNCTFKIMVNSKNFSSKLNRVKEEYLANIDNPTTQIMEDDIEECKDRVAYELTATLLDKDSKLSKELKKTRKQS